MIRTEEAAKSATALAASLDSIGEPDLARKLRGAIEHLEDPAFRIVVFGEFNQGKSTLINALLGADALPMSVVPSTALLTEIQFADTPSVVVKIGGEERQLASLQELSNYTSLDLQRHGREDVEAVRLAYPFPLCRDGVVVYDTPGLNDRAEQDEAATQALDLADMVLFVVDLRRLGTLNERTVLDQWLRVRGLDAVIVAANFINLVPPGEYTDLRERLAAFASRWGCPYLPENYFEVDALGGLRARLSYDDAAWQRSGMGRLTDVLERATSEYRQLLRGRSRLGRLKASLGESLARVEALHATLASEASTRAGNRDRMTAAGERAEREIEGADSALRTQWGRERALLLANVRLVTALPQEEVPDLAELCRAPVLRLMAQAQDEYAAALRRVKAELPEGPALSVKVRQEWKIRLPEPDFSGRPDSPLGSGIPRDRDAAAAAAKELASEGKRIAGKAAAGIHRGLGSLLDRASDRAVEDSRSGRILDQARGAWSNISPPEPGESAPKAGPTMTGASRATIEAAITLRLGDVDDYLDRLARSLREAVRRRIDRHLKPSEAETRAAELSGLATELKQLTARL